jgi:uroporphyrinogen decarboxylase
VDELIPEMIQAGVDVFDPFQPEVMDIFGTYNKYSDRLAFWGGLSVQRTFPFGTAEEVTAEGRMLLDKMGAHGKYIFSPSHTLTGDIPPVNIKAFLDLAKSQQLKDAE